MNEDRMWYEENIEEMTASRKHLNELIKDFEMAILTQRKDYNVYEHFEKIEDEKNDYKNLTDKHFKLHNELIMNTDKLMKIIDSM